MGFGTFTTQAGTAVSTLRVVMDHAGAVHGLSAMEVMCVKPAGRVGSLSEGLSAKRLLHVRERAAAEAGTLPPAPQPQPRGCAQPQPQAQAQAQPDLRLRRRRQVQARTAETTLPLQAQAQAQVWQRLKPG